jgi:hypothetical protein
MDREDYLNIQFGLGLLVDIVVDMDLAGFLQWIERAETLGPILAPTLYVQASGKLGDVKRLAEAAKTFQDEVNRQMVEEQSGRDTT